MREVESKQSTTRSQDSAGAAGQGPGKRTLPEPAASESAPVQRKADGAAPATAVAAAPSLNALFGVVQRKASVQLKDDAGTPTPAPAGPVTPPPGPAPAPPATIVSNQITDGPYIWPSRFEVTQTGTEYRVVVKPKLVPDAGVTPAQVLDVKQRARAAFTALFDDKFILTDAVSHAQYHLRVDVQFVDSGEHYTVALHVGPDGNGNLTNWYTGNYSETLAHELGHQLGLKDEYIDASAPARATATSPGVHTDHSIMGNYLAEGRPAAGAQLRHGQTIGNEIGGATGRSFTITRRP